jgi:predicted MPP superfamily phosphohydrolase
MGNMGLTGLHALPMHKSWVEFAEVPMPVKGLPQGLEGQKIVQISDLHYSPVVWESYLLQYIEWINELRPAVVAVTGDLYMGGRRYADRVARLLAGLRPTHGVVCVMGNHDYGLSGKAGSKKGPLRAGYLEAAIERHGLLMLRNEVWRINARAGGASLTFVGLDDHWAGRMRPEEGFAGVSRDEPVICLLHNPDQCTNLMGYPWQWMLTGHTHGRALATGRLGQRLYPNRYRHFTHGLYTVNGRHVYVNRGVSYGQRGREWCRPEITVFELRPAVSGSQK